MRLSENRPPLIQMGIQLRSRRGGLGPDETLSTKTLAEFHGVPKEYLSKALQALAQADIIVGTLGPTGGYRLARRASLNDARGP